MSRKTKDSNPVNGFYAILTGGEVRRINLTQKVTRTIRDLFINAGAPFLSNATEQVVFNGNYVVEDGEILYVPMTLNENVAEVLTNSVGIPLLNLKSESIKTLFWVEGSVFYFQNFDTRKLLSNRNILVFDNLTYDALKEDAFIVDGSVQGVFQAGKFLFFSYSNANKIFSLSEFYVEATNAELESLSTHPNISVTDLPWFLESANSAIRKQVTLLQKSRILDSANNKKIKKSALEFNLEIVLDKDKKIVFPKDIRHCKNILVYLNEQFYVGLISGTKYRTNSKRVV